MLGMGQVMTCECLGRLSDGIGKGSAGVCYVGVGKCFAHWGKGWDAS